MPNLTSVGITAGLPTSGTGTVSTLDGVISSINGPVTTKPASTPAAASDIPLVVALHPSSLNSNGQKVMVSSAPVVIASDQTAVPVSNATLPLPTGAATSSLQSTINATLGTPMQTTGGTVGLVAGSAKIGTVTTDQTTPGTTDLVHASQQGTWTVQPGNTPNTAPWLVQSTDASGATPVAGTGSGTLTSTGSLFSLDTSGYGGISVQVTSAGTTCTITYEGSNDNSTWVSVCGVQSTATGTGALITTSTLAVTNIFVCSMRYFRARVSTYTSGTVTAFYTLRKDPPASYIQNGPQVTIAGSVTTSSSSAASATGGYSYTHIAAGQATTTVKSGSGTLHSIVLNSAATATNVTTIFDSLTGTGTVIGIPNVVATTVPSTLIYDLAFTTGLTILTATANGGDMTVCYK